MRQSLQFYAVTKRAASYFIYIQLIVDPLASLLINFSDADNYMSDVIVSGYYPDIPKGKLR